MGKPYRGVKPVFSIGDEEEYDTGKYIGPSKTGTFSLLQATQLARTGEFSSNSNQCIISIKQGFKDQKKKKRKTILTK